MNAQTAYERFFTRFSLTQVNNISVFALENIIARENYSGAEMLDGACRPIR